MVWQNLNQSDVAKQLLTPVSTQCTHKTFIENYGCELFNLIGTVEKEELISTFTTAVCEYWNVSEIYTWDNTGDLKVGSQDPIFVSNYYSNKKEISDANQHLYEFKK